MTPTSLALNRVSRNFSIKRVSAFHTFRRGTNFWGTIVPTQHLPDSPRDTPPNVADYHSWSSFRELSPSGCSACGFVENHPGIKLVYPPGMQFRGQTNWIRVHPVWSEAIIIVPRRYVLSSVAKKSKKILLAVSLVIKIIRGHWYIIKSSSEIVRYRSREHTNVISRPFEEKQYNKYCRACVRARCTKIAQISLP